MKTYTKDFYLVVAGQIISILGASLLRFALSLYVLDTTGRADLFATLSAISYIPRLLMPLGGAMADRFNRRDLMVIYDFSSSAIVLCLFMLMTYGNLSIIAVGTVMVLLSIISSMYTPAVNASVPLLVSHEKIENANGIVIAVQAISDVAAPILGGILYEAISVSALVVISSAAFFSSAVMEVFIRIPFIKKSKERNIVRIILKDLKDGFIYVVKEPFILRATILAALLNLILAPLLFVGAPIILRVSLKSTETMYGIGMSAISFAAVLGALIVGTLVKKLKISAVYRWLIIAAVLILPVAFSVMPLMPKLGYYPRFTMFLLGIIPISMILTLLSVFAISKVQKETSNENLGKVMAIIFAAANCTSPVGQVIYGAVFENFKTNVWIPVLAIGAVLFLAAIATQRILKNEQ
ncbi:MAG: MFS transporter [Eubacterium sp.]|jgi:MFS family permease|nr:MFS transporter [Eubacterium sp.]